MNSVQYISPVTADACLHNNRSRDNPVLVLKRVSISTEFVINPNNVLFRAWRRMMIQWHVWPGERHDAFHDSTCGKILQHMVCDLSQTTVYNTHTPHVYKIFDPWGRKFKGHVQRFYWFMISSFVHALSAVLIFCFIDNNLLHGLFLVNSVLFVSSLLHMFLLY